MVLVCGAVPVGIILPVYAQGEYVVFPETASVSSSSLTPLDFKLKAISKPSGDVEKVSGFKLDPVNVLSLSESGIISAASTDQAIVFEQAKAKSSTDSLFELQKASIQGQSQQQQSDSGFSIAGLTPGVYTLDLIGTKNGAKAAYEGILVIAQDKESPQVKQVVEKEIKEVEQDTTIVDIVTIFQTPPAPLQPQQQQLAAIPLGGQAPVNPRVPQALAGQQPPTPSTTPAPQSDIPPDGTRCTGVDNIDIGVYKNGKCTPETLPAEPTSSSLPTPGLAAPRGTIPSCILTADCPPSPSPQALAAQPQTQCEPGFEGIPPQCTPIKPGNEPTDLLSLDPSSLDPNDPLFGEPGGLEETGGEGEDTENLEDADGGESESDSESNDNGGEEEEGDGEDSDSGEGGEE